MPSLPKLFSTSLILWSIHYGMVAACDRFNTHGGDLRDWCLWLPTKARCAVQLKRELHLWGLWLVRRIVLSSAADSAGYDNAYVFVIHRSLQLWDVYRGSYYRRRLFDTN